VRVDDGGSEDRRSREEGTVSAELTYHVRAARLSAVVAGRVFHLPTQNDPSRILSWEKVQELRSGKHTLWDHCLEPPRPLAGTLPTLTPGKPAATVIQRLTLESGSPAAVQMGLYDWPGEYAQRFDGVGKPGVPRTHPGSAVYVGDRHAGMYLHGGPPCNLKRCVVVLQQWDDLIQAVAAEKELSFAIVF
jgi:hypothetical protein